MTSWFLKDCPKCGGDLYEDPYVPGSVVKCLQCGLEIKLAFLCINGSAIQQVNSGMKHIKEARNKS